MIDSAQAGMAERLHIAEREWHIVAEILARQLTGRTVWAFGSRASGRGLKKFSDLDLAVEGRLTAAERSAVSEAFDESLVRFKVDIVEMDLIDTEFRERIKKDFVAVQSDVYANVKER